MQKIWCSQLRAPSTVGFQISNRLEFGLLRMSTINIRRKLTSATQTSFVAEQNIVMLENPSNILACVERSI